MGLKLKYLLSEMGAVYPVKIIEEVKKHQKCHHGKPVLIFDFIATIVMLNSRQHGLNCAGRYELVIHKAEEIFNKLRRLGIELVFFLDGTVKEAKVNEWCRRANNNYKEDNVLFEIFNRHQKHNPKERRFLKTYYDNYLRVAKNHGRIFVSTENECDVDLAAYAKQVQPLAVLASDHDFVIMEGDWPIWNVNTMNLEEMTVEAWNKSLMRERLGLQQWQMPIFATLIGNDWMPYWNVKHIKSSLEQRLRRRQDLPLALSHLVRSEFSDPINVKGKLIEYICKHGGKDSLSVISGQVTKSIESYDYECRKTTQIEPDWLRDHVLTTFSTFLFNIATSRTLYISHRYCDLSQFKGGSLASLVVPLMRRELGIFHCNDYVNREKAKINICLKPSKDEPFAVYQYFPIYPHFKIPEMQDILAENSINENSKIEILSWVVSPETKRVEPELLKNLLNTIFIVPALILNILVAEEEITIDEADVLLLSIWMAAETDSKEVSRMSSPTYIDKRAFWLSYTYTSLVYHFNDAMLCCGLHKYIPFAYFDGYIFHPLLEKFLKMTPNEKILMLKPIKGYRLYA